MSLPFLGIKKKAKQGTNASQAARKACFSSEDWGDMFLRNVSWLLTDYAALYPRRQNSCKPRLRTANPTQYEIHVVTVSACAGRSTNSDGFSLFFSISCFLCSVEMLKWWVCSEVRQHLWLCAPLQKLDSKCNKRHSVARMIKTWNRILKGCKARF
jgi:hypothetical protein